MLLLRALREAEAYEEDYVATLCEARTMLGEYVRATFTLTVEEAYAVLDSEFTEEEQQHRWGSTLP